MTNLILKNDANTMTLKEITDLLDVRHNNAMITVASMTLEEGFCDATEIQYRTFKGNS
jgi:hypothetical protein